MNKIYRCIYNEALGTWVAVSELAQAKGKRSRGRLAKTILATSLAVAGTVGSSAAFAVDLPAASYSQIIVDGSDASVTLTSATTPVVVGPIDAEIGSYPETLPDPQPDSTIVVANGAQFNYSSLEATNNYASTAFNLLGDGSGTLTQAQQAYLDKNATDMAKTTKGKHGELELAAVPAGVVQIVGNGTFGTVGQAADAGNTLIHLGAESSLTATGTAHGIYAANQTGNVNVTIAGDINTPDRVFGATYTGNVLGPAVDGNGNPIYVQQTDGNGELVFDEFNNPVYVQLIEHDKPVFDENGDPVYLQVMEPTGDTREVAVVTAGGGHGVYVDTLSPTGIYPETPQAISITQLSTSTIAAGGAGIKGVAGGLGTVSISQDAGAVIGAGDGGIAAEGEAGDVTVAMAGTINSGGNGIHAHAGAGDVTVNLASTAQIVAGESGIHAHTSNFKGEEGKNSGNKSVVTVATADGSSIQAAESGIHAHSGGGNVIVNNAADIVAATLEPINNEVVYANSSTAMQDISNGGRAIHAHSGGGTVTVNSSGDLLAYEDGIYAHSGGHNDDGTEFVNANKIVVNTSGNIISAIGNGIRVNTAGAAEITNTANITAAFRDYVPVEGDLPFPNEPENPANWELADMYAILGGAGDETVNQQGGTLIGGINLKAGDDTLIATGGKIVGDIWMEAGSDTLSLKAGTDVSELSYLDGGSQADTLNIGVDLTGFSAEEPAEVTYPDKPILPGAAGNVALVGWETVNVQDGAVFSLSGDLNLSGDSEPVPTIMMLAPTTTGTLNIEEGSTLALAPGTLASTVTANVNNFGTIDLHRGDAAPVNTLTVEGNYAAGSDLIVDVNLATGASDQLVINGTATGNTHVTAINGLGDVTAADQITQLPTVIVTDPTGGGTFTGMAGTSNAGEGQLISNELGTEYSWTLNALNAEGTPIYKAEVSGYTQMPYANTLLGYDMLGTLHDRVGEQQTWAWDKCGECQETQGNQVWARVRGGNTELTGDNRLDMEMDNFVAQLGYDFSVNYNPDNGSRRHTGFMLGYGQSKIDFFDQYRAENAQIVADKFTGEGTTDAASVGLYSTYYDKNGSYLDLVGQVSYLQNEYKARDGHNADQDGWGAGLSAEVGRPYKLGNSHWLIEPQAQLSYQFVSLEDFNDGSAHVDQDDQHSLRGRIGTRLAYNAPTADYRTKTFYAVANVLSDFIEPTDVNIGRDKLNEDYSRTWGEVGLGMQLPIATSAYVYADARYQQELSGEDRNGYTGTIGLKHSW
jgi:autotransporter family porin